MYYPAYIGSHNTKLEIYIFQKITIENIGRYIHIPVLIESDTSINYNAESGTYPNQQHITENLRIFVGAELNYLGYIITQE